MLAFTYEALPSRVVFAPGSLERLPDEVVRLGAAKALVLCTPEQRAVAEDVTRRPGARAGGILDRAATHVPIETARAARPPARGPVAAACVAVGGRSKTGPGNA